VSQARNGLNATVDIRSLDGPFLNTSPSIPPLETLGKKGQTKNERLEPCWQIRERNNRSFTDTVAATFFLAEEQKETTLLFSCFLFFFHLYFFLLLDP